MNKNAGFVVVAVDAFLLIRHGSQKLLGFSFFRNIWILKPQVFSVIHSLKCFLSLFSMLCILRLIAQSGIAFQDEAER